MEKIAGCHHHIDNGGLSIWVEGIDDEYRDISIHMQASYFGYPAVEAVVRGWGYLGHEELKQIGLMFLEAANKEESRVQSIGK